MQKLMNERRGKKGFTLAELLIVVAIIAVLVAIAIPIFSSQLEKSRESTDIANVRSAYAEVMTKYLDTDKEESMTVEAQQTQDDWQGKQGTLKTQIDGQESTIDFNAKTSGNSYTVKVTPASGDTSAKVEVN